MSIECMNGTPRERSEYLNELCTMLCIGDESYIRSLRVNKVVPILVQNIPSFVDYNNEMDLVMIVRSIALILDFVPRSCPTVVSCKTVSKLIPIIEQDISTDLKEEILKCFDKISIEKPEHLLENEKVTLVLLSCLQVQNEPLKIAAFRVLKYLSSNERFDLGKCSSAIKQRLINGSPEEIILICECFANMIHFHANGLTEMIPDLIMQLSKQSSFRVKSNITKVLTGMCIRDKSIAHIIIKAKEFIPTIQLALDSESLLTTSVESIQQSNNLLMDVLYLLQCTLPPSSQQNIQLHVSKIKTFHEWKWEDDYHNFEPYSKEIAQLLEDQYKDGTQKHTITVGRQSYEIDFQTMKQMNVNTGVKRNIQRDPIWNQYTRHNVLLNLDNKDGQPSPKKMRTSRSHGDYSNLFCLCKNLMFLSCSSNMNNKYDALSILTNLMLLSSSKVFDFIEKQDLSSFVVYLFNFSNDEVDGLNDHLTKIKSHKRLINLHPSLSGNCASEDSDLLKALVTKMKSSKLEKDVFVRIVDLLTTKKLSPALFFKSNFANALSTLFVEKINNPHISLLFDNQEACCNLIALINMSICFNSLNFDSCPDDLNTKDLEQLNSLVRINIKHNKGKVSLNVHWLTSMWQLKKHVANLVGVSVFHLTFNDAPVYDHQLLYEVVQRSMKKSKSMYDLLESTGNITLRVEVPSESISAPKCVYLVKNECMFIIAKTIYNNNKTISRDLFLNRVLPLQLMNCLLLSSSIERACCGSLPTWMYLIFFKYSFLLSFKLRYLCFKFCVHYAPRYVLNTYKNELLGDITKDKKTQIKIKDRENALSDTLTVMDQHAGTHSLLEFNYDGEPAVGSGPSIELYTLVSQAVQKGNLNLWVNEDDGDGYVKTDYGLFPMCLNKHPYYWMFIGQLLGKALEDERLTTMQLSLPLCKMIIEGGTVTVSDFQFISKRLYSLMKEFSEMSSSGEFVDMGLDFTFNQVELIKNGSLVDVTKKNFDNYVKCLIKHLTVDCCQSAVEQIRKGMSEVINLSFLNLFHPSELREILGGNNCDWGSSQNILDNLVCTHGYISEHRQIQDLAEILCEFDDEQKKLFLEFSTGSPQLPVGWSSGIKVPKLTVVKYVGGSSQDEVLPTCNTCFHYLKLPEYSSKEIMKEKLLLAITMGRGSFGMT
ncbi:E3 ubiquitin-protein ligase TRIP [Acrasis kona]|uniref:E3 ubiquitin-protein ligase TRIP12 n=1 Tax=Acrasis kona TaxID=1008807 RepID=A0AAW2ZJA0_9EUKA